MVIVGSSSKIDKDSVACIVRHIDSKSLGEVFLIVNEVVFINEFFKLKS